VLVDYDDDSEIGESCEKQANDQDKKGVQQIKMEKSLTIKNIPERRVLIDDDESGEDGEESTSDLFKSPTALRHRIVLVDYDDDSEIDKSCKKQANDQDKKGFEKFTK
jgi:hypothetical protein